MDGLCTFWVLREKPRTFQRAEAEWEDHKDLNSPTGIERWHDPCARMLTGVLRGLDFLHLKGVVHRDLKPQKVLVSGGEEEEPVISDFETCSVESIGNRTITMTVTRNVASAGNTDPKL